jgi:hypothetical protein
MSCNRISRFLCGAVLAAAVVFPVFPLGGIGAHYGIDLSLSMEDALKEQAPLASLRLDTAFFGGTNSGFTKQYLSGSDLPLYVERTDWKRHWFNMGGKFFVDFLPFVNTAELSVNFGMWEYLGKIIYPTSIAFAAPPQGFAVTGWDTTLITSDALGLGNPFVKNTPYAKLQFDLTAKKIKLYGGAGISVNFATPVLSGAFIEKTLGTTLAAVDDVNSLQGSVFGQDNDAMVKIGKQFMKELMTPHMGMHFDLGASLKLPIMPVGVYVDAKYLIPLGDMDKEVSGLTASGILLNSGLSFSL